MKRILTAIVPCALLALASCGESSYEVHQTYFYPMNAGGMTLYADQQTDSVRLISLDSWTLTTGDSWLKVSPTTMTVPATYSANVRITLTAEPNTTGATRLTTINVQSYDAVSMPVYQVAWLNITTPSAIYNNTGSQGTTATSKPTFPLNVPAAANDTTITFRVYQDNATLTSDAEWIVPDSTTFKAGTHNIKVRMTANSESAARTAKLTLTSAGVATDIQVSQSAKKD